jgi:hypothetical protein
MYGAGVHVFAVWGYVISHTQKSRVELNPKKLADTLGATMDDIADALKYLESPDPKSRFKSHDGRRLVKEGEFQYFVPSFEAYRAIRSEDDRREYNRIKQAEHRKKKLKVKSGPSPGETAYVTALERGATQQELDRMTDETILDR